ncbi:MAG: CpsD/CapB family tyrosine-protein kinase, partial [Gemmataceae bacterium]|nr:CpsD/CapB family tyrosine-protein kinase [Gemmataceae bacterium]
LRRPRFSPELVAFHAPTQPAALRYRDLHSAIREAVASKAVVDHFVLLFSGVRAGVGTTNALLNVAISAARQESRTLVIDANLRRPAVAGRVGLEGAPGLTDVLASDSSLDAAIRPTDQENLFVLPAGEPQPLFADIRTLHDLVAGLRERYDYVFVDGPPWDGRPLVSSLASGSGAVFLVLPAAEADSLPASDLIRDLPRQGVRLAGSVLIA